MGYQLSAVVVVVVLWLNSLLSFFLITLITLFKLFNGANGGKSFRVGGEIVTGRGNPMIVVDSLKRPLMPNNNAFIGCDSTSKFKYGNG